VHNFHILVHSLFQKPLHKSRQSVPTDSLFFYSDISYGIPSSYNYYQHSEQTKFIRVRTDLGTDSGPHLVHCISHQCRSIFVHWHRSNSTSN